MMSQHSLMPCAGVYMCVYFRRHDALMSKHFLHDSKIRSVFHKMGGE